MLGTSRSPSFCGQVAEAELLKLAEAGEAKTLQSQDSAKHTSLRAPCGY